MSFFFSYIPAVQSEDFSYSLSQIHSDLLHLDPPPLYPASFYPMSIHIFRLPDLYAFWVVKLFSNLIVIHFIYSWLLLSSALPNDVVPPSTWLELRISFYCQPITCGRNTRRRGCCWVWSRVMSGQIGFNFLFHPLFFSFSHRFRQKRRLGRVPRHFTDLTFAIKKWLKKSLKEISIVDVKTFVNQPSPSFSLRLFFTAIEDKSGQCSCRFGQNWFLSSFLWSLTCWVRFCL